MVGSWFFYRHEDLSREPVKKISEIYEKIEKNTHANDDEISTFKRDSESNIWKWKKRLTKKEILRIREGTEEIANEFYTDKDWNL